ncbi:hypothetical protein ABPG72_001988 [Tetrahymena utriculariae]
MGGNCSGICAGQTEQTLVRENEIELDQEIDNAEKVYKDWGNQNQKKQAIMEINQQQKIQNSKGSLIKKQIKFKNSEDEEGQHRSPKTQKGKNIDNQNNLNCESQQDDNQDRASEDTVENRSNDIKPTKKFQKKSSLNEISKEIDNGEDVIEKTVRLKNGAEYSAQWKNGLRHGKGKQIWLDGSVYEGDWYQSKGHGYCKLLHADGDKNEGQWKNYQANWLVHIILLMAQNMKVSIKMINNVAKVLSNGVRWKN